MNFLSFVTFAMVTTTVLPNDLQDHESEVTLNPPFCPDVKPLPEFDIFRILGSWFVAFYFSSSEEALTYDCMRVEFGLSQGNMDMRMKMTYRFANDPDDEPQTGNMTFLIPDPRRSEHWLHIEDHYRGIYNTDVIDTDYSSFLLLLHCSEADRDKRFLSTFVLSRRPKMDRHTENYLKEKIALYSIDLEYLFPVNQLRCLAEGMTVTDGDIEETAVLQEPVEYNSELDFGHDDAL